jgi:hypothetical protein
MAATRGVAPQVSTGTPDIARFAGRPGDRGVAPRYAPALARTSSAARRAATGLPLRS